MFVVAEALPKDDYLTPVDIVVIATLFLLTGLGIMQRPIAVLHQTYGKEAAELADSTLELVTVFAYALVNLFALVPNYFVRLTAAFSHC